MVDLRNRPLLDTRADQARFVDRAADVDALLRALELRFNVLVVGERGVGTSSLLGRVAALREEQQDLPPLRWVRAGRADTPAELLGLATEALDPEPDPLPGDTGEALLRLAGAAQRHGPAVLVVDGLASGRLAHAVFGRMRDELWQLGDVRWVVGLAAEEEALALTPPADQFFEVVHHLAPLAHDAVVELLRRRDPDRRLDDATLADVAAASQGNPSVALRLARAALAEPGAARSAPADVVAEIAQQLGPPAARLAAELSSAGSSGPSDDALLARLGWSRPRAYQVFHDLEAHGYVTAAQDRNGRPGRPRKLYRLKEAPR